MTLLDLLKLHQRRRPVTQAGGVAGKRRLTYSSSGWIYRRRVAAAVLRADGFRRPTNAIAAERLYPPGPNGGYMIWVELKDEQRPRKTPRYVLLEMLPPDPRADRDGWYAIAPWLSSTAAAAALGVAWATFRDLSRSFVSRRESNRRVWFVTEELYGRDVPALDKGAYPTVRPKGRRRGRHASSCPDPQRCEGPCAPKRQDWNRRRGRSKYDKPERSAGANDIRSDETTPVARQPLTVAAIHAAIPRDRVREREALYAEQATTIAEEIAAGRFVAAGEEVP